MEDLRICGEKPDIAGYKIVDKCNFENRFKLVLLNPLKLKKCLIGTSVNNKDKKIMMLIRVWGRLIAGL